MMRYRRMKQTCKNARGKTKPKHKQKRKNKQSFGPKKHIDIDIDIDIKTPSISARRFNRPTFSTDQTLKSSKKHSISRLL